MVIDFADALLEGFRLAKAVIFRVGSAVVIEVYKSVLSGAGANLRVNFVAPVNNRVRKIDEYHVRRFYVKQGQVRKFYFTELILFNIFF